MVSLPCLPVLPCNRIGSTQEDTRAITRYAHPQCSNKISNKINVGPSPSISRKAITESARGTECKSAHGTAPAPSSGLPPEGVPSERDFPTVAEMVTNVNREAIRHYCGDSSSARVAPIERQRNPCRCSSSHVVPGFRGACHRAGHFGPDPLAHPGYKLRYPSCYSARRTCGIFFTIKRQVCSTSSSVNTASP
jgi:hypothetical protein